MPIYTMIAGVDGVGKSSLTGVLKAERNDLGCIIDVDRIASQEGCTALQAGKIAINKINYCMNNSVSFAQETTLSGYRVARTAQEARAKGYAVRLFYIGLNTPAESVKRIRNRVERGGHDIPRCDVERRFAHRFDALSAILPLCDDAVFYDNDNGFVEVGVYRNGEIIKKGDYAPTWFEALIRHTKNA